MLTWPSAPSEARGHPVAALMHVQALGLSLPANALVTPEHVPVLGAMSVSTGIAGSAVASVVTPVVTHVELEALIARRVLTRGSGIWVSAESCKAERPNVWPLDKSELCPWSAGCQQEQLLAPTWHTRYSKPTWHTRYSKPLL
ncbi:hypothetical protein TREES_T100021491 [Tupaia chinensis]|uniref:Uncharacterized protein n=1 Tax=Tupaia chinensis TaxID=246437 RepID=L9KHE6_TUPCH|nr:hypothetical protein TREES_T100021491 [Tupaia chinensis]